MPSEYASLLDLGLSPTVAQDDDGVVTSTLQRSRDIGSERSPRVSVPVLVVDDRVVVQIDGVSVPLHPQWLRERSMEIGSVDATNGQRLYEPTDIATDVHVLDATDVGDDLDLVFSDGHRCRLGIDALATACGLRRDPEARPRPKAWRADDLEMVEAVWADLDDPHEMMRVMQGFFETGCFVLRRAPADPGTLIRIAGRFGRISPTNFGMLFDVRSKPNPDDLAYTAVALSAHTDQPYRTPTPGLQFLHALVNDAPGGDSTVVDGLAAVEALQLDDPEAFGVLCDVAVEFRYDIGSDVKVAAAPLIDLDAEGSLRQFRFSPRLDFAPAVDPAVLDVWYRGRRRMAQHLNDTANQVRFRLDAGDVLVVDNHRVLHGRTAFDPTRGHRHVQGCYIDHDGPATLWRLLVRDGISPIASSGASR